MNLRQAMYISNYGYGPCSPFSLAEWLHAREMYRKNQEGAQKAVNLKPYDPVISA